MPTIDPELPAVSTPDVSTSTPPGSKGEKKKSKAAQRQPQAEAQEPVSPTTTKEDDSAAGTEDIVSEDGEKKNQYVETLNKRLRALKKKMLRIAQYEAILNKPEGKEGEKPEGKEKEKLNDDQLLVVSRKSETIASIKELEDLIKQLGAVEAEDLKLQKRKRANLDATHSLAIQAATSATERRANLLLLHTLHLLHLVHMLHGGYNTRLTEPEAATLNYLHNFIFASAVDQNAEREDQLAVLLTTLRKVEEGVEESVAIGEGFVSFARVKELIQGVLGSEMESEQVEPPAEFVQEQEVGGQEEQERMQEEDYIEPEKLTDMAEEIAAAVDSEEEEDTISRHVIVPSGGIRFMGTSEIFDVPAAEESQPPSQFSVVPITPPYTLTHPTPTFAVEPSLPPQSEDYVDSVPPQSEAYDDLVPSQIDQIPAPPLESESQTEPEPEPEPEHEPEAQLANTDAAPFEPSNSNPPPQQSQRGGYRGHRSGHRGGYRGSRGGGQGGPNGQSGFRGNNDSYIGGGDRPPHRNDGERGGGRGDGERGGFRGDGERGGFRSDGERGGFRGDGYGRGHDGGEGAQGQGYKGRGFRGGSRGGGQQGQGQGNGLAQGGQGDGHRGSGFRAGRGRTQRGPSQQQQQQQPQQVEQQ